MEFDLSSPLHTDIAGFDDTEGYDYFDPYDLEECVEKQVEQVVEPDFNNNFGRYQRRERQTFNPNDDEEEEDEENPEKQQETLNMTFKDCGGMEQREEAPMGSELASDRDTVDFATSFASCRLDTLPRTISNVSSLSQQLESLSGSSSDFFLPAPANGNGLSIEIYCFATPDKITINIPKRVTVSNAIKHILTLYRRNKELMRKRPLKYPEDPSGYELRLIDDDEDFYVPYYEISPLDREGFLDSFPSLGLCEVRGYQPTSSPSGKGKQTAKNLNIRLAGSSQIALTVHINTPMLKETLIEPVEQDWSLYDLIHFLNHKRKIKIVREQYEFRYFDEDNQIEIKSVLS